MSTAAERSEIAVLKTQMEDVKSDISELKTDVKEIKTLLLSSTENGVSRKEFEDYKKSQVSSNTIKTIITILATALITAMAYALIVGRAK